MNISPIKDTRYKFLMVIPMMRYATLQKLIRAFPSRRNESAAHYFERLAEYLEDKDDF